MMKFFRKYTKELLALFMALLMIVFVGGPALQSILEPSGDRLVGRSRLGDITYTHQQAALGTTQILERLGLSWQRLFGVGEPLTTTDWILLTREAQQLGTQRTPAAAKSMLGTQLPPDRVAEVARSFRIKPDRVLEALGEFTSVREAARAVAASTVLSEAEVRNAARKTLEKVRVQAVVLPASAFVDDEAEFTADQIQTQFEAYKERKPGQGLEFGYYVPPQVKVQYVKIDRDAIAERVGVANLESKARKYFDEHRQTDPAFQKPPEQKTPESEEDEPAPDKPKEDSPYLDWDDAKEIAKGIVRKKYAIEATERIADWLIPYLSQDWMDIPRGEDGYKATPGEVRSLEHYSAVLKNIPEAIAFPGAVSIHTTDFFSSDSADDVPGIGKAVFAPPRGVRQKLAISAFRNKGVVPTVPGKEGVNMADYLAMFQTSAQPLTDPDGNIYVFRVIDVRDEHAPTAVDEVRDRVVADLRLLQGYDFAKARAEGLLTCIDPGLKAAFESDAELTALKESLAGIIFGFFTPPPFPRTESFAKPKGAGTYVPHLGLLPANVIDEVFDLQYAIDKVQVVELKDRATVLVVEWLEAVPGKQYEFEAARQKLVNDITESRSQGAISAWLDPANIRARNEFQSDLER